MEIAHPCPSLLYTGMKSRVLFRLPIRRIPSWEREVLRRAGKAEIRYCRPFLREIPVLHFSDKHPFRFANHGIATCRGGIREGRSRIHLMI